MLPSGSANISPTHLRTRLRMPTLTQLNLYPIKSCAGIALREAILTDAGLMAAPHVYDREWMVVDAQGKFLTQREFPKMALIAPRINTDTLELRAPGMLRLEIPLALPANDAATLDIQIWGETLSAYDCDDTAAKWFSQALGTPCRLVRFHADARRVANPKWTGGIQAPSLFADGFPVLVISEASLADLNQKLTAQGRESLPMNRFRPNVVLGGIGAFEEDYAESIRFGDAILKPVKPCPRCPIPSVNQDTGEIGPDPLDILRTYRANSRLDGAITFGMNAIVLAGAGQTLRVGQPMELELAF